jgi:aldehyde:ferredoxin oxidoreductase
MFGLYAFPVDFTYELIEAITGNPFNAQTAHETGQRIFTMRHAFNLREGLKRSDFETSPRLFGQPPFKSGPTAGVTVDNENLADQFFTAMKWDKDTLYPSKDRLEQLGGLEAVINTLYS